MNLLTSDTRPCEGAKVPSEPPGLTVSDVSYLLHKSTDTVRRLADNGEIACERTTGGQRRFYLRAVHDYLEGQVEELGAS